MTVVDRKARPPLHWLNISFLTAVHLLAIAGLIAYVILHGITLPAIAIGLVGIALTTFAISAGYHRLFAHRTYETGPVFRFLLLVFGAGAFQNSAINWAADHRRHHRHVDTPRDPYDAKRGFWYSHIGWVLEATSAGPAEYPVPDLETSSLLSWQHRYYMWIGTATGFILPWLIGWALGDAWGGLLFGGLIRLVVSYHVTFSINSLAHWIGTQPYSQRNTARDGWLTALVTMGEGYHNYHHTFPSDYRNGVRLHHFDPPKWVLCGLEGLGVTRNLKRTPAPIIARARMRADLLRIDESISSTWRERVNQAVQLLNATLSKWTTTMTEHQRELRSGRRRNRKAVRRLKAQLRLARRSFWLHYRQWQTLLRELDRAHPLIQGTPA